MSKGTELPQRGLRATNRSFAKQPPPRLVFIENIRRSLSLSNSFKIQGCYINWGRGSRVFKVLDRGWPCHEFEPITTKDPPFFAVSVTIVNRVQKMSQIRRLPNSLRWRAVGWMEMGLSQADVARRLNVSRSVVQRLWDQYQSEDSVSRRPVSGRPRATPFSSSFGTKEKKHYCAAARCRPLSSIRKKNLLYYGAKSSSQCRFTMESDSGRLLIWGEQRTRYHQSNTVERHSYRGGGILVWAGISLGGHTDLHVFHGGTVTGLRYRDEILDPYVRPYAAAIGNDFILMDDNARPHRAGIVEEYLEDHGLERMEWPARSPDLNPIEYLWDYLGREVAALNPPPRSLHELKQGLLCVWSSLPIPVSDNLINSMGNRCRQCIQFGLAIHQNDHQARRRFVEWAQNQIAVVPDFHQRILFSDEAHFWLNGYVNKQNCHIWSEANPQVYVETLLHPEKLTVWCALWAGGILLQKR
ncbi:transposable element Tc3 transposase [Trichonephila clavipes]|nr:transposable element Tc3 transposase [Trichonephila clavipes]